MAELRDHISFALRIAEIDRRKKVPDRHEMSVGVVETGKYESALSIDNSRLRTREPTNVIRRPDRGDPTRPDRDRFRFRIRLVHGSNLAVDNYQVRRLSTRR